MWTPLIIVAVVFSLSGFVAGYLVREAMSRRRRAAARKKFHHDFENKVEDWQIEQSRSSLSFMNASADAPNFNRDEPTAGRSQDRD
jgi:hypothetical protein